MLRSWKASSLPTFRPSPGLLPRHAALNSPRSASSPLGTAASSRTLIPRTPPSPRASTTRSCPGSPTAGRRALPGLRACRGRSRSRLPGPSRRELRLDFEKHEPLLSVPRRRGRRARGPSRLAASFPPAPSHKLSTAGKRARPRRPEPFGTRQAAADGMSHDVPPSGRAQNPTGWKRAPGRPHFTVARRLHCVSAWAPAHL